MEVFNDKNFNLIYDIMKQSFPKSEIRSFTGQKNLLKDKRYKIYCYLLKEEIVAFICVWHFENYNFLEHFAVAVDFRNNGIGTFALQSLLSSFSGLTFLEAEPPESEIQKRRINFYQRVGFFVNEYEYFQPAFSKSLPAVPLKILTYGKGVSYEDFYKIKALIYKEVYHKEV